MVAFERYWFYHDSINKKKIKHSEHTAHEALFGYQYSNIPTRTVPKLNNHAVRCGSA